MAEAVAGLLTSAFVKLAKDKLSSAIAEQANILCNFGSDLVEMKEVLETISATLEDAERRSIKEELVRLRLKRLKDVAVDISDVLEDYQDTCDQATAQVPVVFSCLPITYKKIVVANRMKSMREKLSKINMEFKSFEFAMQGTGIPIVRHNNERETTSNKEAIRGRDVEKQDIINLLSTSTNNDEAVFLCIWGFGGMGKSTLAQLVYKDTQFKDYDHRIWVYVSQDFNLLKIGNSIISQLQIERGQQNRVSQQEINLYLHNLLSHKKVLIVLDDLWEEEDTELDRLKTMLRVEGSLIDVIVTTRKKDIALKVSTTEPYELQPLTDDICWEIIKRYSEYDHKSNPERLEWIGLDIANKCGGVALAAQAVGYSLRFLDDPDEWIKIKNSDFWNESSKHGVLPSLKLSYERMPPRLRLCFSFCAIFPKGHNIVEDELIHQWIALDFIEPSKGKEYIKQLLAMSFLQVSKVPSITTEDAVQYTMHDLVHELAKLTIDDELIIFDGTLSRDTHGHKYCRYSLLRKYDGTTMLANILPPKLRALNFSDCAELNFPDTAFSFLKCLRTLDFSESSRVLLPASIGLLKQLRCLIAPRIQNKSLPKSITDLSKLQYLNINGSSLISTLPESFGKLGCLTYLCLSGCSGISKLPESFGDLKCMVHLDMSGCSEIIELPDSFGKLTNLRHLGLSCCWNLRAIPDSLCCFTQLQHLNLSHCSCLDRLPKDIGNLVNLRYLNITWCNKIRELPESLMRLQNLLHLDLSHCTSILSLGVLSGLTALQHLELLNLPYVGSEELDVLGNLTSLKFLRLNSCIKPRHVYIHGDYHYEGAGRHAVDFIGTLTNLEHLDLSRNSGLECLPESIGNLKRLHTLNLTFCRRLKSLPESIRELGLKSLVLDECLDELRDQANSLVHYSQTLPVFKVCAGDLNGGSNLPLLEGAHHVSELRILALENVRSLEEANKAKLVDKKYLKKLTLAWTVNAVRQLEDHEVLGQLEPPRGLNHLNLEGYSGTSFPGWLMGNSDHLTNLVSLYLRNLFECSKLPRLGQLPHLQKLILSDLPKIKTIDWEFCGGRDGAFSRLEIFSITFMEGLEEWNTAYFVEDVVKFMFPVLDSLVIQHCPRVRLKPCPPTFRECIIMGSDQAISSLEDADTISHDYSRSQATKLDLCVADDYCRSMKLFRHFPALRELTLANLTSLPESILQLTSLESLSLQCCHRMSALPEWLGDLSSLQNLDISDGRGIKSLPSSIQQLTRLQKLKVYGHEELKKWCESKENKTKLAHITIIEVNGRRIFL